MALNPRLKAFVRLDGQLRVIAGSLIYRKNKPRVGKWMEIVTGRCCVPVVLTPFGEQFAAGLLEMTTTTTLEPEETTTTTTTIMVEETTTTTTTEAPI